MSEGDHPTSSPAPDPFPDRGLRAALNLVLPGLVGLALCLAALVPGALAFDIRDDFGLRPGEIGALVAIFYLLSAVCTQATVPLARVLSPTVTVRIGLVVGTVALLLPALIGTKTALVAAVVISGVANGFATPAGNMLIALNVPRHKHGLAFGLRVCAVPASAGVTALGALLVAHSPLGWRAVCLGGALLCLAVLAATMLVRTARLVTGSRGKASDDRAGLRSLRVLSFGGLLAATACATLSPFLLEGLLAGGAPPGVAALLLGISAWLGVAARITTGLMADRHPDPAPQLRAAAGMLTLAALGMVGLAFGGTIPVLTAATVLTFGIGWAWPGLLQQSTLSLHPTQVARAISYVQQGTYVGALIGPLGFGLIVELSSFRSAWLVTALAATLGAVTLLLGLRASGRAAA
jgi:MFS family permease